MTLGAILAAAAVLAGPASAEPWVDAPLGSPPAALLAAAQAATRDVREAHVAVLHEAGDYVVERDGSVRYRYHQVYRILRAGFSESWASLDAGWSPWLGERPTLRARVISAGGAARTLDEKTIVDGPAHESAPDTYSDRRVVRTPLPGVAVGSVVEIEILRKERSPLEGAGTAWRFRFGAGVPIRRARLSIDVAAGVPFQLATHALPGVTPQRKSDGGRQHVVFDVGPLAPLPEPEDDLPVDVPRAPEVVFSTGKSWQEVARRYHAATENALRGSDLGAEARALGAKGLAPIELARRANAWLRARVRYTGVELGEASYVPRTPAQTLARGFGDCKDQALLLAALLRAAGVPARLALIATGGLDESLPAIDVFDHVIVVVPGKQPLWIDPTSRSKPTGQLPVAVQGRPALVLEPSGASLATTPRSTADDNRMVETRELVLAEQGPARVIETTEWHGALAGHHRHDYERAQSKELDEHFREYMKQEYEATSLDRRELRNLQDPEKPLSMSLESKAASRGYSGLEDAGVWLRPADLLQLLPEPLRTAAPEGKPRRQDYALDFPFRFERRYRIVPPEGFASRPLPQNESRALGLARFEKRFSVDAAGVVSATFTLELGRHRLTPAEVEALRNAVLQHDEDKGFLVGFDQIGEAHLAAGRTREALRVFEQLVARRPQSALAHTHLARALLQAGLGRAARAESARAMQLGGGELEVGFAHAHVLSHDLFGRQHAPGADLEGAERQYRALARLDPKNVHVRQNLAVLLEHNARGERYGTGARLTEALVEYRAIRDLGDHDLDGNLMAALLYAGKHTEVIKLAGTMREDAVNGPALLTSLAIERGAQAAQARALKLAPDGEARAALLEQTKNTLAHFRRYAEGAVLIEEAARASAAHGATYRAQAEVLRRLRGGPPATGPIREPRDLFERLFRRLMASDDPGVGALVAEGEVSSSITAAFGPLQAMRRQLARAVMPAEVVGDFVQAFDFAPEGSDALGYRLTVKGPTGERYPMTAFVVRQGRELRLTALPLEPLRRVQARDWPGARHWLEWARDGMNPRFAAAIGFGRLWLEPSEDPRRIELAAAALAFAVLGLERALPVVAGCKLEGERDACDRALAFGYLRSGWPAEALRTIAGIRKRGELPASLQTVEIDALLALRSFDDAASRIDAWQRRAPQDALGIRYRARLFERRGQLEQAAVRFQQLADTEHATADDLNELAWIRSCLGKATERDVQLARKAVQQTGRNDPKILHTLATLLAETGKPEEARDHLHEQLALVGRANDGAWYTLGRIAEAHGLRAAALDAYRSVAPPRADTPAASVSVLAARAIKRLDGASATAPANAPRSSAR